MPNPLCTIVGALIIAAMPAAALAQNISFHQDGGAITNRSLVQSGNATHSLHGLDARGISDPSQPARFAGDFDLIYIRQESAGPTSIGIDVSVANASSISAILSGTGAHQLSLNAVAGSFNSSISTSGSGAKIIKDTINALGADVTHTLTFTGAPLTVDLNQNSASTLTANLNSIGLSGATATLTQSGSNAFADISGDLNALSTLAFNQGGNESSVWLSVDLGQNSTLSYSILTDGLTQGSAAAPVFVSLADGENITITYANN